MFKQKMKLLCYNYFMVISPMMYNMMGINAWILCNLKLNMFCINRNKSSVLNTDNQIYLWDMHKLYDKELIIIFLHKLYLWFILLYTFIYNNNPTYSTCCDLVISSGKCLMYELPMKLASAIYGCYDARLCSRCLTSL